MAHLPQTSRPIFLSSCFIKPVWLDMDANMDARICIFACMPASMWLCIFKGICGTIHVYINKIIYMYVCTCLFLLFACICMHSRVYLPPKLVLAEKQDWTILFTNGILMRRKFKEFTNLLNINQHHLRTHQSNKCKDVFQLFSISQTSSDLAVGTFFRVLGADEVLQRVDRTWSDSPTGKSSGQVRLDDCGGFALDLCVKCKQK